MLISRVALAALFACACHNDSDLGFDIVKVPLVAYADAAPRPDASVARADGGHDAVIVCVAKPGDDDKDKDKTKDNDTDDTATNDEGCPTKHDGRNYDERVTARHRKNADESEVCCYRRGRVVPSRTSTPDDD
jgi:hypothetical protein